MDYRFCVKGHLAPQWSEWLDGLTINHTSDGMTILRGEVRDQAALYGLIIRIRDMGAEIIALMPEGRDPEPPRAA